ncbi:protein LEAD-SENSITIVE 1-like [Zingiber officinale]|uniref:protein LEAD-SENSITIVE 1-like n=1 Tax=Zingiber officinale TaxID=94328 RepID=UPI001C4D651B|nr:protein LEAD-SENSITIVE 1-like [Zingiber officinale]
MGVLSNKIERKELIPGDHIYTWRSAYLYSHHGIFAGDDMVIHFTRAAGQETGTGTFLDRIMFSSSPSPTGRNLCERCGDQSRLHGVIMSCLDCFLSGGNLYLFCYAVTPVFFFTKARGGTCTLAHSDSPDAVLYRARFLHDNNGFGMYNIFKNNCEDFAIYCKTGLLVETTFSVGRSGQISSLTAALSAIASSPLRFLTTTPVGLVAVSGTMYCVGRYVSDIGIRRDAKEINVETLVAQMHTGEVPETTGAAGVNPN